jgi:hypothetical protein
MMGKYLITFMTFFIFTLAGYSQSTILTIVGKKVSVSRGTPVTVPFADTVTNLGFTNPFTGEKVDTAVVVKFIDPRYTAVYKITELISGDFDKDTICFAIRNGNLLDSSNDVLLIFGKGKTGHFLKRPPIEVYPTKDNCWASPYITEMEPYPQLKPRKTGFKPELVFDVGMYDDEYVKKHYPSPYYKIKKDKAIAVQGVYAEELSNLNWY